MAVYLAALLDDAGRLPLFGDDDGGRVFHPYGERQTFAKATLETCAAVFNRQEWRIAPAAIAEQAAWWLGEPAFRSSTQAKPRPETTKYFPDAGVIVMRQNGIHLVMKAGGMCLGSAAHSHPDALSLIARRGTEEILIEPPTYTYISSSTIRDSL